MQVDRHTYLTNSLLLNMMTELCVKNGRCTSHTKSFISTSLKVPHLSLISRSKSHEKLHNQSISTSTSPNPLSQQTQQKSPLKENVDFTKSILALRCKLFQKAVTNVTLYYDSMNSGNVNLPPGLDNQQSLAMLSPFYFANERTICHTYSCMTPLQLTLKYDMFARKVPLTTYTG